MTEITITKNGVTGPRFVGKKGSVCVVFMQHNVFVITPISLLKQFCREIGVITNRPALLKQFCNVGLIEQEQRRGFNGSCCPTGSSALKQCQQRWQGQLRCPNKHQRFSEAEMSATEMCNQAEIDDRQGGEITRKTRERREKLAANVIDLSLISAQFD